MRPDVKDGLLYDPLQDQFKIFPGGKPGNYLCISLPVSMKSVLPTAFCAALYGINL